MAIRAAQRHQLRVNRSRTAGASMKWLTQVATSVLGMFETSKVVNLPWLLRLVKRSSYSKTCVASRI